MLIRTVLATLVLIALYLDPYAAQPIDPQMQHAMDGAKRDHKDIDKKKVEILEKYHKEISELKNNDKLDLKVKDQRMKEISDKIHLLKKDLVKERPKAMDSPHNDIPIPDVEKRMRR